MIERRTVDFNLSSTEGDNCGTAPSDTPTSSTSTPKRSVRFADDADASHEGPQAVAQGSRTIENSIVDPDCDQDVSAINSTFAADPNTTAPVDITAVAATPGPAEELLMSDLDHTSDDWLHTKMAAAPINTPVRLGDLSNLVPRLANTKTTQVRPEKSQTTALKQQLMPKIVKERDLLLKRRRDLISRVSAHRAARAERLRLDGIYCRLIDDVTALEMSVAPTHNNSTLTAARTRLEEEALAKSRAEISLDSEKDAIMLDYANYNAHIAHLHELEGLAEIELTVGHEVPVALFDFSAGPLDIKQSVVLSGGSLRKSTTRQSPVQRTATQRSISTDSRTFTHNVITAVAASVAAASAAARPLPAPTVITVGTTQPHTSPRKTNLTVSASKLRADVDALCQNAARDSVRAGCVSTPSAQPIVTTDSSYSTTPTTLTEAARRLREGVDAMCIKVNNDLVASRSTSPRKALQDTASSILKEPFTTGLSILPTKRNSPKKSIVRWADISTASQDSLPSVPAMAEGDLYITDLSTDFEQSHIDGPVDDSKMPEKIQTLDLTSKSSKNNPIAAAATKVHNLKVRADSLKDALSAIDLIPKVLKSV